VNGHLIPDFAIRRLKKDGTGFLRSQDPNRRVQDGVKKPLLCENCDGRRFSDAETSFASRIFHPFLDGQALQFDCSEADRYFIASLVWRAIVSRLRDPAADDADYLPEDLAARGCADFRGTAAKQRSVKHLYHAALRNATGLLSIA
jgi:hypothetical protein